MFKRLAIVCLCTTAGCTTVQAPATHTQTPSVAAPEHRRQVTVLASATVQVEPTKADISIANSHKGISKEETQDKLHTSIANTMEIAVSHGVATSDIRFSQVLVQPTYHHTQQVEEIIGYNASKRGTMTVHDLRSLPTLVQALTKAGVNIEGIALGVDDPSIGESLAREQATRSLLRKATELARGTHMQLGGVVNMSESVGAPTSSVSKHVLTAARSEVAFALNATVSINAVFDLQGDG